MKNKMSLTAFVLVTLLLLLCACNGSSSAASTPVAKSSPTMEVILEPTAIPTLSPEQTFPQRAKDAYVPWSEEFADTYSYALNQNGFNTPFYSQDYNCAVYKAFSGVIQTGLPECTVTSKGSRVDMRELIDVADLSWGESDQIDELFGGLLDNQSLNIFFDGEGNWRKHDVIPNVLTASEAPFSLVKCAELGYYTHTMFTSITFVTLQIDGAITTVNMPSFAVLEYDETSYRLPESCISENVLHKYLADSAVWYATDLNAKFTTFSALYRAYGLFVPATLEHFYPGDGGTFLIDIYGTKYLVPWSKENNPFHMETPEDQYFNSYFDPSSTPEYQLPVSGTLILGKTPGAPTCLTTFDLPEGLAKELKLSALENQKVAFKMSDYCYGDYILKQPDGGYLWVTSMLSVKPNDVYIDGRHTTVSVSGYLHYEEYTNYMIIASYPRDVEKDTQAVTLLKRLNSLSKSPVSTNDLKKMGPIWACNVLVDKWHLLSDVTYETVEYICNRKLTFDERYDAYNFDGVSKYWLWSSTIPYGTPTKIVPGFEYESGSMSLTLLSDQACVVDSASSSTYGVILRYKDLSTTEPARDKCIAIGSYIWVLDHYIEYSTLATKAGLNSHTLIWQVALSK